PPTQPNAPRASLSPPPPHHTNPTPETTTPPKKKKPADKIPPAPRTPPPATRAPPPIVIRPPPTVTSAPNSRSAISEWSRDFTGSITVVCPDAYNPANSTHDFTCALGTGSVYSIAFSFPP